MAVDVSQMTQLLKKYSPAHLRDISASLSALGDELEYTKVALSKELMDLQGRNDFTGAREILDVQEELSKRIQDISNLLSGHDMSFDEQEMEEADEVIQNPGASGGKVDYSLYGMDDTIAYDIGDTPVTFKRPAAFSFNGKKYHVTKWKTMFSKLCDLLFKENPEIIRNMMEEEKKRGIKHVKMSTNKADIHSPVRIAGSDIWLETNRSAADIRKSILVMLKHYDISPDSLKVFFRRDYALLHENDDKAE